MVSSDFQQFQQIATFFQPLDVGILMCRWCSNISNKFQRFSNGWNIVGLCWICWKIWPCMGVSNPTNYGEFMANFAQYVGIVPGYAIRYIRTECDAERCRAAFKPNAGPPHCCDDRRRSVGCGANAQRPPSDGRRPAGGATPSSLVADAPHLRDELAEPAMLFLVWKGVQLLQTRPHSPSCTMRNLVIETAFATTAPPHPL